jgi:peroxiredoxin
MLDQVFSNYKSKGFRIVGINVDTLQDDAGTPAQVAADARRFLVEHNVRFTNLINGTGESDFATAYGVREIPASFLIDRDGRVCQVDLSPANIDKTIKQALGK